MLWWLQHTDPSPIHNRAISDYEEKTGDWVLRTSHWGSWVAENPRSRCLWIHGIPGAGKTVLAAHLVQELSRVCETAKHQKWVTVYYYCHHLHNQDEATPFLRWLLCQLCRQTHSLPAELRKLYGLALEPSATDLLQGLASILQLFDKVFVVVDALDESQPHENLLTILQTIGKDSLRFGNIQLLATSREYASIERVMVDIASPLSMSTSLVTEDIRRYIVARIQSNPVFQRWPEELRAEVEEALSTGAKGMFRWALCQLDILRRLKHKTKIREAIRNLPKTLDETYERIYSYIPPEDRELVRHCLRWIMFHNTIWYSNIALSATVLVSSYQRYALEDTTAESLVSDLEMIKDSCGCLLSYQQDDKGSEAWNITLAHYTVREFLESDRARSGQSAFFAMPTNDAFENLATIMFETALQADIVEESDNVGDYLEAMRVDISPYCLLSSLQALCRPAIKVRPELAFDFMDPSNGHLHRFLNALKCSDREDCFDDSIQALDDMELDTAVDANLSTLTYLLWLGRLDLAAELLLHHATLEQMWTDPLSIRRAMMYWTWGEGSGQGWSTISGNIVDLFAVSTDEIGSDAFEFLLDHARGLFNPTTVLLYYIGGHRHESTRCMENCPLRRLLKMGADPNARGSPCTPLQIAVVGRDVEGIQTLLQAGADPLSLGDVGAAIWPKDHVMGPFSVLHGKMPLEITGSLGRIALTDCQGDEEEDHVVNLLLQEAVDLKNTR